MEIHRCDSCNYDVHRASYAKILRIKKHLENIRQDDIIKAGCLFKEEQIPIKRKIKNCIALKHQNR